MKTSLNRWFERFRPIGRRRMRRVLKYLGGCAALALATTWAPPAQATVVHLSVTPTQSLTNTTVVFFHRNGSYYDAMPLGSLAGGQIATFDHDIPGWAPEDFFGPYYTGYALIGLHGPPESLGVALSFPNDNPITSGETWDTLLLPWLHRTEQSVIDQIGGTSFDQYFSVIHQPIFIVPFETQATIVNFTSAAFGGTAFATIVPEPGCGALLASGAGLIASFVRRRR